MESYGEAIALAEEHGFRDKQLFSRRDLALALVARGEKGDLDAAAKELGRCAELVSEGGEKYFQTLLDVATGELMLALAERGFRDAADMCLGRALTRARKDGYARYLPPIREAMGELELVEPVAEERGRLDLGGEPEAGPDGYSSLRAVGKGAFGQVFRAYGPRTARVVAVKLLRLEDLYDPRTRTRQLASARLELDAAAQVRHSGVARVLAVGEDTQERAYVVQEFVEGHSLRDEIPPDASAGIQRVVRVVADVASALEELHANGVVHRDLKPENVMIRGEGGRPVLIDFGIARVPNRPDVFGEDSVVGTLPIRFPEPYFEEILSRIQSEPPTPLDQYRTGVPPAITTLIERMLRKKRRKRPSAGEVSDTLRALA